MRIRNFCYDLRIKKIRHASVPVISVGNLTLGGTGKTPLVAWIAEFYQNQKILPGLISRGYQSQRQYQYFEDELTEEDRPFAKFLKRNDEANEMALRIPALPHFQTPNRFEAAQALLERFPDLDILILDDAFQHRKIHRNLDVVLLDALQPFGYRSIFPRGMLREPLSSLKRADIVLLSRADLISSSERIAIQKTVTKIAPLSVWGEIQHYPEFVFQWGDCRNFSSNFLQDQEANRNLEEIFERKIEKDFYFAPDLEQKRRNISKRLNNDHNNQLNIYSMKEGTAEPFAEIENRKKVSCFNNQKQLLRFSDWKQSTTSEHSFVAFCGLGNPDGFFQMLKKEGIIVQKSVVFPDHHCYTEKDFRYLQQLAVENQAWGLLTTMKDIVKIQRFSCDNIPLYAIQIGIQFLAGEEAFRNKLIQILRQKNSQGLSQNCQKMNH